MDIPTIMHLKNYMNKLYFNHWEMFIATFSPCAHIFISLVSQKLGLPW